MQPLLYLYFTDVQQASRKPENVLGAKNYYQKKEKCVLCCWLAGSPATFCLVLSPWSQRPACLYTYPRRRVAGGTAQRPARGPGASIGEKAVEQQAL